MLRSSHTILETSDICNREICVLKGKHIGFSTEQHSYCKTLIFRCILISRF